MTVTRRALLGLLPWLGALGLVKLTPVPPPPAGGIDNVVLWDPPTVRDIEYRQTLDAPATFRYTLGGPPWPRVGEEVRVDMGRESFTGVVESVRTMAPREGRGWADVEGRVTGWRRG
jgi:hypothetical protein